MSSTHVIFSALAANAILFLPSDFVNYYWLGFEGIIWVTSPIISVTISAIMSNIIEGKLMAGPGSIYRMVIFIPY
jgi:hypothetical protein